MEHLFVIHKLGVTDCELIYESAFLNAIARFEGLLYLLLQEFVCGPPSANIGHYPLVRPRSRAAFRVLAKAGRPYLDLLPYKECKDVSSRFLNDGKPFTDVDDSDVSILGQALLVRNAIAHRSDAALSKFRKSVSGVNSLAPHKQFPGAYLRRAFRFGPTRTWNDLYMDTIEKVGLQLAKSW